MGGGVGPRSGGGGVGSPTTAVPMSIKGWVSKIKLEGSFVYGMGMG